MKKAILLFTLIIGMFVNAQTKKVILRLPEPTPKELIEGIKKYIDDGLILCPQEFRHSESLLNFSYVIINQKEQVSTLVEVHSDHIVIQEFDSCGLDVSCKYSMDGTLLNTNKNKKDAEKILKKANTILSKRWIELRS